MPEETAIQPEGQHAPSARFVEPREGVQRFYSNHIDALWTPHDVSMKFNFLTEVLDSPNVPSRMNIYEQRAVVTLAWTQAKHLAQLLGEIVSRYENINGEIDIGSIP